MDIIERYSMDAVMEPTKR